MADPITNAKAEILAGRAAEVEEELRALAASRRETLGAEEVGYGRALGALAEAELALGRLPEALDHIGEAASIFWSKNDPDLAPAIALEAELLVRVDGDTVPFAALDALGAPSIEALALATIERVRALEAPIALDVLKALRTLLLDRLGESHGATIRVLAGVANTERELGDVSAWRDALAALAASFECVGATEPLAEALLQRGLAEHLLGDADAALASHDAAAQAVAGGAARSVRAKVLRLRSRLLLDLADLDAALGSADAAIEAAGADAQDAARGLVVRAEVLGARGQSEDAQSALDRALIELPPDDPELEAAERLAARLGGRDDGSVAGYLEGAHARVRARG